MQFDSKGWLDTATRRDTENRYKQANPRDLIVMHYTAGYDAKSAIDHFARPAAEASAHFVVDVDGDITQMVSTAECAWHAGYGVYHSGDDGQAPRPRVNEFSIGIEIVNPGYHFRQSDGSFVNWQRKPISPARLAPFPGMTEAFDPWVGSKAYWPNFPLKQLEALEDLTRALIHAYPSIEDVVSHRDVDGVRKRKVDPGPAFPLRRYRMLLDRRVDPPVTTKAMQVDNPGSILNVRSGPGTTFGLLDWSPLQHGDHVDRLAVQGDWSRIRRWVAGTPREGWAATRYLKPV